MTKEGYLRASAENPRGRKSNHTVRSKIEAIRESSIGGWGSSRDIRESREETGCN